MSTASPSKAGFTSDQVFRFSTSAFAAFIAILFIVMLSVLWHESQPSIDKFGFSFLTSSEWNPVTNEYGALIAIIGTLLTTLVAMAVALPISLGIALFLAEIAPYWMRTPVGTAIELLAAIPSIVYGMWGLFVVVPIMASSIEPWMYEHLSFIPLFSTPPLGIGILTAGLVLALMVIPFIASITRDVFLMCPQNLKESAYGLGATKWEVVRDVMIPYGIKGIVGAVFLGLGRALGETMAVTFVIGNAYHLSWSLLAPGNSIASTLANEFTEADGALYTSSLIELGLVLFLITFIVLSVAEYWLHTGNKKRGG